MTTAKGWWLKSTSPKKWFSILLLSLLVGIGSPRETLGQPFSMGLIGTTMPYNFSSDTSNQSTRKYPGFRGGIKFEIDLKLQKDLYLTPSVFYFFPGEYKNSLDQTVTTAIQSLCVSIKKSFRDKLFLQGGVNYSIWRTTVEGSTSGLHESGRLGFQGGIRYSYRKFYLEVLYAWFGNTLTISETFTIKRHSNGLIFGMGYTLR